MLLWSGLTFSLMLAASVSWCMCCSSLAESGLTLSIMTRWRAPSLCQQSGSYSEGSPLIHSSSPPLPPTPIQMPRFWGGQRVVLFLSPRLPFSVRPLENPRYFKIFSFPFPSAQASTWHEIVKSCCIFHCEGSRNIMLIVIDFGPYDGSGYFP
ncbi:uncharacterized protein LACBIDRAFT_327647 [Laccaria bicolor S238N-H82]|uniref:Predicted protein n=1 Tax=Laccaria bicolor (strain S238N-H82 / ATCC MYA-4686) TaxID=486041 RepID=B0DCE3_LACBS|nr:uncharacterized protein LACBIDRAFT_327647 [Laccaria bicolor S238N-H82]EDR07714.1 predicted protein [Laccaria bicolor S238N-H82]|eukprot:XP_001881503.1 predicted protein [Laccaria bicolor S238N-H82]